MPILRDCLDRTANRCCAAAAAAVTTSINGMSALEELRQHPNRYDLVLSDVYMPGEPLIH